MMPLLGQAPGPMERSMDQAQAIGEVLRMLRRRLPLLALATAIGVAASIFYALGRPPLYETSAKILVEPQQITDELARSTVNLSAAERLQLIEQRLLARDSLVAVIERLGLFADAPGLGMTDKVELMRAAVRIDSISVSGQNQGWGSSAGLFAFTITVRLGDAEQAAEVANEFVDSAIQQNLRVRAERARDTLAYFEEEEARVGASVAAVEAEIAAFKKANEDALPESLESRREELARLRESELEIERRTLDFQARHAELATALEGGRALGTGALGPEETELRELELELAQKRRVLAASHPEIRRLQDRIAAVSALLGEPAADAAAGTLEDQRDAMRREIAQLAGQIELLQGQGAEIAARRAELDAEIRRTPEVELGLSALTRRLADLRDQLSDISRRRAEARTGEQLEATQQSERFQVVESALVPEYPVEPNRKKIVVLGSGASGGLALGLVFLLEMLNPVLRSSGQMERQLGIRPVVTIPYVAAPGERWRQRRRWIAGLGLAAVALAAVLVLVDREVAPLAPIGASIAASLGFVGESGSWPNRCRWPDLRPGRASARRGRGSAR
jgi:uncharacterized protein involved in exopolysaccharide biosynthesis